jgi:hypothetical protein
MYLGLAGHSSSHGSTEEVHHSDTTEEHGTSTVDTESEHHRRRFMAGGGGSSGGASFDSSEIFMLNVIWYIRTGEYHFDFLLAIIVLFTWTKFFLQFRVSQTFGPMFRIIQEMIVELSKFVTIWVVILMMFACVGMLAFG